MPFWTLHKPKRLLVNVGKRGVVALNGAALQLENCGSRATKGANAWVEVMGSVSRPEVSAHLAAMHGSVAAMVPMATLKDRGVGCNTYIQDKPSFNV